MDANQLRESFLRFFEERGHRRMPSAPLVPPGDPTLLFTSAGMVQFKPYFVGQAKPPHQRLTSVQKCFRTSDIDSVGDSSHLTFFEMLGNFSVGDYFKAEAIPWAWEFETKVLGLDPQRLWVAVYLDDDEAFDLWRKVGLPEERIRRYGEEHNYWFSGEIGPCGPCSEIYYDFGEQFGCGPACEPSHDCERFLEIWNLVFMSFYCDGEKRTPLPSNNIDTGAGLERVASVLLFESEAWDKSRKPSVYDTELFAPIIRRIAELSGKRYGDDEKTDRAMRIVAEHARAVTFLIGDERTPVMPSNEERGYVVRRLIRRAVYFGRQELNIRDRFFADISDEVVLAMSDAHFELNRRHHFITESIDQDEERFRHTLETGRVILEEVLPARRRFASAVRTLRNKLLHLAETLKPSIVDQTTDILNPFLGELRKLSPTQPHNLQLIQVARNALVHPVTEFLGSARQIPWQDYPALILALAKELETASETVSGQEAFLLHDTFGFPMELTREIAAEHGFAVDETGFEAEMERQRERARAASSGTTEAVAADALYASLTPEATVFSGYESLETRTKVVALLASRSASTSSARTDEGHAPAQPRRSRADTQVGPYEVVQNADAPAEVEVILAETPFYPEGGGQVGDRGEITGPNGRIEVLDTQRVAERLIVHRGRVAEGRIAVGDAVTARVDPQHRADTMRNHTATHLLHAALRQVLGTHVRQAGSLVAPERLRFDFTHTEPLTGEQLAEVERLVNAKVRDNLPVHTRTATFDQAMSEGVLAFFGDKYGEEVRVVEVNTVAPRFSAELCGGTHCQRTGDIGAVIVTGESSIGAGMRRIEALTGRGAEAHVRDQEDAFDGISRRLGAQRSAVLAKIEALLADQDALRKRVEKLERSLATAPTSGNLTDKTVNVDGVAVLAAQVDAPSVDALRYRGDAVRKELASGVAVLAAVVDERPQFITLVSRDLVKRGLHAGEILKRVASVVGGGGGGRPEMAQGGGKDSSKIGEALAIVPEAVREMLAAAKS